MKHKISSYFSKFEIILWSSSVMTIILSYILFDSNDSLTLISSLIGSTFLILNAKGNVWGQILTLVFSILYGIISYSTSYYGEMITYLCMTAPIAFASIITWIKNPARKGKNEVKVNSLSKKEYALMSLLSLLVSFVFYFILRALGTAELVLSTVSVLTSFAASYLTMRRSKYFAIAYASNDVVLIIMWTIASFNDTRYVSVIICFAVFLINDLYGYANWSKMKKSQEKAQSGIVNHQSA